MNAYELTSRAMSLRQAMDDADDGSIDAFELIQQTLAAAGDAYAEEIDSMIAVAREKEAEAGYLKSEAARLTALAKTAENKADAIKGAVKAFLETTGIDKLTTRHYKMSLGAAGGKQSIAIDREPTEDDLIMNDRFIRTKHEWDKDAIRAFIEGGNTLSFARIQERSKVLRIR